MIADEWFVGGDKHNFRYNPSKKWADHANHATLRVPNFYNCGTGFRFVVVFLLIIIKKSTCILVVGRDVFVGKNQRSWRSISRYDVTPSAEKVKLDSMQGQTNVDFLVCRSLVHAVLGSGSIDMAGGASHYKQAARPEEARYQRLNILFS